MRLVVTDFGLARAILPDAQVCGEHGLTSVTGNEGLMGTLHYMAPEQFERGEASVASDIYSLGLVMFEVVTGQRPFADAIPFAEATKRLKQEAPRAEAFVPELDSRWSTTIRRCLELQPKDRFQHVGEIYESIVGQVRNGSFKVTSRAGTRPSDAKAPPNSLRAGGIGKLV
jgi:serine/threonine-protein kinase